MARTMPQKDERLIRIALRLQAAADANGGEDAQTFYTQPSSRKLRLELLDAGRDWRKDD